MSIRDFERLQNRLDRLFGLWNCRHSWHYIILGVSQPAYSPEKLEAYKQHSREEITIDGVTKTRYQWTQEQRRIETAIRQQKDIAVMARASGDMVARRECAAMIRELDNYYGKISAAAGIPERRDKMRAAGFSAVKPADELKTGNVHSIMKVDTGRKRNEEPLTPEQVEEAKSFAISLGMPEDQIVYSDNMFTGYFAMGDRLYIGTDVYPAKKGKTANSLLSHKGAIGHEVTGHRDANLRNTTQEHPILEEVQASIRAAKFTPGLSDEDRDYLWQDARDRLTANGIDFEEALKQLDIWEV